MGDLIQIRDAHAEDLLLIASMLDSMYSFKRPVEFYKWQFFQTEHPVVLKCGFYRDEVIGMFGVQKRMLTNGVICGQASWVNVALAWQGKGVFAELGYAALNHFTDLNVLCIFANANARVPCEKSFNMKTIGVIKLRVLRSLENITRPVVPFTCQTIDANTVFPSLQEEAERFISFAYTQEYRRWRFALNPMYDYALLTLASGEFIIIKKFFDPVTKVQSGDIVDFGCLLDNKDKLTKLFEVACWYLKEQGATSITTWAMSGTIVHSVVETLGFEESNYETYFGFSSLKPEFDYLYDFSIWHLRQSDATNY